MPLCDGCDTSLAIRSFYSKVNLAEEDKKPYICLVTSLNEQKVSDSVIKTYGIDETVQLPIFKEETEQLLTKAGLSWH